MSADSYRNFLEVITHIYGAERELRLYLMLAGYEWEKWGLMPARIGDRVEALGSLQTMLEACQRYVKWVQFGDYANHRDAAALWVQAARALSARAEADDGEQGQHT